MARNLDDATPSAGGPARWLGAIFFDIVTPDGYDVFYVKVYTSLPRSIPLIIHRGSSLYGSGGSKEKTTWQEVL
jgi:hypothetical protein